MFDYPSVEKNAQPGVKRDIENFRNLSEEERSELPLLYWLLGSGTPPFKVSQEDSRYQDKPQGDQSCGNCEYIYLKVSAGVHICSQISGDIEPNGWCDRWVGAK